MASWVGIDFGTGYSSVSIRRNDDVEVIADEQGNRSTPSCVAFTDTDVVVGEAAQSQAHSNLANTVFDIKHLIRYKFSDPLLQNKMKQWGFKVIAGEGDAPVVQVKFKGKDTKYTVEELVGLVLDKIRQTAESFLGGKVTNAVIAVPSEFTEDQREIVRKGATFAQFKGVRIINESAAAAMAHGCDLPGAPAKTIVLADFGAGSLDVTVMKSDRGLLTAVASGAYSEFCGNFVDADLAEHLAKEFERAHKGLKLLNEPKGAPALKKLTIASERAKRMLASRTVGNIELDGFYEGHDLFTNISRAKFESMTSGLAKKCIAAIDATLKQAGVGKEAVDQVICVGGSTKLVKFQAVLTDFFGKVSIADEEINPEEAVVIGAAEEAALCSAHEEMKQDSAPLACSQTVGIAVSGGVVFPMIVRGAALPAMCTRTFRTAKDGQAAVLVDLFQGERVLAEALQPVAQFALKGLKAQGQATVEITVTMAMDGSVKVKATEKNGNGASQELKIEAKGDAPMLKIAQENYETDMQAVAALSLTQAVAAAKVSTADDDEDDEDDEGDEGDESESDDAMLDDDLDD